MKQSLKRLTALLFAVVFALLVPMTVLATTTGTENSTAVAVKSDSTANINVSTGDSNTNLSLYQVITITYDEDKNSLTYEFTDDFSNFIKSYKGEDFTIDDYCELDDDDIGLVIGKFAAYCKSNNIDYIDRLGVNSDGEATFEDVALGQYIIIGECLSSALIYQNVTAEVVPFAQDGKYMIYEEYDLVMKSTEVSIDKGIAAGNVTYDNGYASANVGDTITFGIKFTVPQFPQGVTNKSFYVNDHIEGMRYKSKSVFVYDDNGKSLREGTDYTLEFGEYGGFNIYFNYDNIESYGSEVIYITYDVVLTENTRTDSTYKNFNGASLCYSNLDGYYDCITSVVYVTTYGLIVHKYDNDTGDSLAGAEFAIYDNEKCEGDPIGTITTDSNGYGGYTGLAAGTYYVVETNAPSGYKIDSTPHQVSVNAKNYYYSGHYAYTTATEYTSDINESLYGVQAIDDSGYLLWFNPNDTTQVVTNTNNNKTYIPAYVKSVSTVVDQTDDNGWYYGDSCTVLEVPNVAGHTLPTTGGIGVVPFIALGSVLMVSAVIILVTRKRMNGEQDID